MGRCSACVLLAAALLVCTAAGAATDQPLAQRPTQPRGAAPHVRPLAAPAPAPTSNEQDGRPARSAVPDEVAAAAAGAPLPGAAAPASVEAPLPGPVGSPAWARGYAPAQVAAARKSGDNPLLAVTSFPLYDQIQPMHVEAGIGRALDEVEAALAQLEASVQPTWEGLVEPMTRMQNRLDSTWGIVDHLLGVRNSDALRAAAAAVQPRATAVTQRFAQSPALFRAFQALRAGPLWAGLPRARRTIVEKQLLGFRLAGVNLEEGPRKRLNDLQAEEQVLSTNYSNNLQDATAAYKLLLTQPGQVAGLPSSHLASLAQQARQSAGAPNATAEAGPWLVTLNAASLSPILEHGENATVRELVYRAYISRATSGSTDNQPIVERIFTVRREEAQLLNYSSYTDYALADRMATPATAMQLLEQLRAVSYPAAKQDYEELSAFADGQGKRGPLETWDESFYKAKLQMAKFNLSDEDIRPYFALPTVLDGMHSLHQRIFNTSYEAADGEVPVWHPTVRFYRVYKDSQLAAHLYFDPYARPEKRVGSWMYGAVAASKLLAPPGQAVRLPVAYVVTALPPPVGSNPSLLDMGDVRTVFHEHGHALQFMLTEQTDYFVAGTNGIPEDAVEEPSQFMEFWSALSQPYDEQTLNGIARHYQTGAPMPGDLRARLLAARNFRQGTDSLRQLRYAIMDLALYSSYVPRANATVEESPIYKEVISNTTVLPRLEEDKYYSYKWAEVLSADGFNAFQEAGLSDGPATTRTGMRYRATVLALGGGVPPGEVFVDFRGRNATTTALLVSEALLPGAAAKALAEQDAHLSVAASAPAQGVSNLKQH